MSKYYIIWQNDQGMQVSIRNDREQVEQKIGQILNDPKERAVGITVIYGVHVDFDRTYGEVKTVKLKDS